MQNYKGAVDTDELNTNEYDAGDCLVFEVGDWNGTGFSYHANGSGCLTVLVVETFDDKMVVIPKSEEADWRMTGDRDIEFEVGSDGFLSDYDSELTRTERVKSVEHQPGRSGYHKVQAGIEKSRNQ